MDLGTWGEAVAGAFEDAPALVGLVAFFGAVGALAAWEAWSRRAAAKTSAEKARARRRK